MSIIINGEPRDLAARTIAEVVEALGLPPPALLIEHNGDALRRDEWSTRTVSEGDRVELLRIAAGG